jgi:hypothetical protein
MAELPTINNAVPQVQAPQPRVSPGQAASPYLELASTLNDAAKETGDVSKLLAHNEGLKAVTRDEAGNVQVQRPPIVGDAAIHYQHAVTMAAAADGEAVARNDFIDLRKKFEDDPEGFRKAAKSYRQEKVGQYEKAAGPDVGLTLGRTIDSLATENYRGLLNRKETRDLNRATDSIQAQIETTKNELFAIAAGGDQTSPEYTQRLQKIGALWGQLRDNPRLALPQQRIDFEMSQLQSQLYVAGLDNRIGKIQAEKGLEAALAEAHKVRTDPTLNLSPGVRYSTYNQLLGSISQRVNGQKAVDQVVAEDIKSLARLGEEGHTATPERIAAVRQAVIASKNPALVGALQEVEAAQPVIAAWQKMSPAQLDASLNDLDRTMREDGASENMQRLHKIGTTLLKNMREGIKSDPMGWASRTGAVGVTPIDFAAPDAVPQMQTRVATAETVAAHYGVTPSYLRPDERAIIESVAAKGGKPMLEVASMLVNGFGDRASAVLGEISKESPALAHIGGLLTGNLFGGGSPAFARDVAEGTALRQNPDAAKLLPHWVQKPSDKVYQFEINRKVDQYGDAFLMVPDNGRAAEQSAKTAFAVRAMRNGYDPQSIDTGGSVKAAYNKTLQEAAGATFSPDGTQYGGVAAYKKGGDWFSNFKVIVPGQIRTDRFKEVIGSIKDDDLRLMPISPEMAPGKTATARELQNAVPVAVRGGYRFAVGDPASDDPKWIRGADNRPFVLNLDRLEPELRKRVPGAYAGGR